MGRTHTQEHNASYYPRTAAMDWEAEEEGKEAARQVSAPTCPILPQQLASPYLHDFDLCGVLGGGQTNEVVEENAVSG